MAAEHPFTKDFGYLGKFFAGVRAFAEGLPESEARARLLALTEGEPERWAEIDALLSQVSSQAPASSGAREAPESEGPQGPKGDGAAAASPPRAPQAWTVGPLVAPPGDRGRGA